MRRLQTDKVLYTYKRWLIEIGRDSPELVLLQNVSPRGTGAPVTDRQGTVYVHALANRNRKGFP